MFTRKVIASELERLPEQDLDKVLYFLLSLKEAHAEIAVPTLAAESALAKDWLNARGGFSLGHFVRIALSFPA